MFKKFTFWRCVISVKIVWYSWLLHILCNSTSTEISKHFKLNIFRFAKHLQNISRFKDPILAKSVSFFQISWKITLWKSVNSAKILQWLSFLHIYRNLTECMFSENFKSLRPHLQKWGSQRPKNGQKCTKTSYNTFAPRNSSRHCQMSLFFNY